MVNEPFNDPDDWCELCTYFAGSHAEHELTPTQWAIVDHLLGLGSEEPFDDAYLTERLLPAILDALRSA